MVKEIIKSNFERFCLKESAHTLKNKYMRSIQTMKRNNGDIYDGYCFVPKGNGSIQAGAFIKYDDLGNPNFITTPKEIVYYDFKADGFFKFFDKESNV